MRHLRGAGAWSLGLAAALAVGLATMVAPAAQAEVCTGGYPTPASGPAPDALLDAVGFLRQRHYTAETLPQWRTSQTLTDWGHEAATGWYGNVSLWNAMNGASWWVMPTQSCNGAVDELCLLVASELTEVSFDCLAPSQIAGGTQPHAVQVGGRWLISGFARPGAGAVTVNFANGTRVLPALGGVYGGPAPASLGAVGSATFQEPIVSRPVARAVVVDQTGISSKSRGPLASLPRLRAIDRTLRARLALIPTILGTAVSGRRARTLVLYAPGAGHTALAAARALHAATPKPLSRAQLTMFGSVAQVVVFAGRR